MRLTSGLSSSRIRVRPPGKVAFVPVHSLSQFIPSLIHQSCALRGFDLRAIALGLFFIPDAHVRFAGCENRQDQIGLGAEAATGVASRGWFDPGSQLRVAALRTWRVDASPPVM